MYPVGSIRYSVLYIGKTRVVYILYVYGNVLEYTLDIRHIYIPYSVLYPSECNLDDLHSVLTIDQDIGMYLFPFHGTVGCIPRKVEIWNRDVLTDICTYLYALQVR